MFDTLRYSKILESAGLSRAQAEAHIQVITEIVEDALSTKQDIKELKNELTQMESRIVIRLGTLAAVLMTIAVAALTLILRNS